MLWFFSQAYDDLVVLQPRIIVVSSEVLNMENKRGLVLGGGGSRGSYEVGVCLALKELGYSFDVVTGVSIGEIGRAHV